MRTVILTGTATDTVVTGLTNGLAHNFRVRTVTARTPDAPTIEIPTVAITNGAAVSRSFTLPAGSYRFEVVAINSVGDSVPSARSVLINPR